GVFRIDPNSDVDDGDDSCGTKPDAGGSIMQGRKRRNHAALWRTPFPILPRPIGQYHICF
ncbi:MAG: hypothetical protein ACI9W2_001598, partial [Gammaproteobacteria bacterium]